MFRFLILRGKNILLIGVWRVLLIIVTEFLSSYGVEIVKEWWVEWGREISLVKYVQLILLIVSCWYVYSLAWEDGLNIYMYYGERVISAFTIQGKGAEYLYMGIGKVYNSPSLTSQHLHHPAI